MEDFFEEFKGLEFLAGTLVGLEGNNFLFDKDNHVITVSSHSLYEFKSFMSLRTL